MIPTFEIGFIFVEVKYADDLLAAHGYATTFGVTRLIICSLPKNDLHEKSIISTLLGFISLFSQTFEQNCTISVIA